MTRNGEVVRDMPTSIGKTGHETPNGTYIVGERFRDMYMDSSTYGVPVDSPEGYRTTSSTPPASPTAASSSTPHRGR